MSTYHYTRFQPLIIIENLHHNVVANFILLFGLEERSNPKLIIIFTVSQPKKMYKIKSETCIQNITSEC